MENYFHDKGSSYGNLTFLSPQEAYELLSKDDAILVDLRESYETNFRLFDVPNVIYLPKNEFRTEFAKVPADKPVILADNAGLFTKELALFLLENGYTQVACLNGGVLDWVHDNMPLKIDRDYELTGQCACKLRPRKGKKKEEIKD